MATFTSASKKKQKLRLAITGLAGSGKTYSALRIANGMGRKIAVIDSEHCTSELYADKFEFDICAIKTYEIEEYVEAIKAAGDSGYDVIIIDSLSHAWDKLLERVDRIAEAKYRGNSYYAWRDGGELQKKLVEAILSSPSHVIGTIRTKAEYAVEGSGKDTKILKLGTAPKQREGFEYELSLIMELSQKHTGFISKDRTGKFQDKYLDCPGEDFGKQLVEWLDKGDNAPAATVPIPSSLGLPTEMAKMPPLSNDALREKFIASKTELNAIMSMKDREGHSVFTQSEVAVVFEAMNNLKGLSGAQCVEAVTLLLADKRKVLAERTTPAKTDGNNEFKDGFLNALSQKQKLPAMFTEEEGPADEDSPGHSLIDHIQGDLY